MNYATVHDTKPDKQHWGDKVMQCSCCQKWIHIPHNVVGGAWYLGGYSGTDGKQHYGTYCQPCFHKIAK